MIHGIKQMHIDVGLESASDYVEDELSLGGSVAGDVDDGFSDVSDA
jgi:hypothetical protein